MAERRRALGRGLGALIPTTTSDTVRPSDVFFRDADRTTGSSNPADTTGIGRSPGAGPEVSRELTDGSATRDDSAREVQRDLAPVPGARFAELPVTSIRPNPRQPRTVFDEDEMAELVHSIAEIGVLQPIVVREITDRTDVPDGIDFELIMGERRWRASAAAGLELVPAIVKDTKDDDLLRDALLENLHRSQLNALEEAAAYQQLLDDFGCSHEELAARIGRSRPQISNTLRLLRLPPLVARRLAAGVLSAGHARALLGLEDPAAMERLAQRIVAEGLSVRSVEEIVAIGGDAAPKVRKPRAGGRRPQLDDLAARLSDHLDTRVTLALGQRKGRLTVEFASVEDLNRIVAILGIPAGA
jgi:ParB family chromosome partitioning protein